MRHSFSRRHLETEHPFSTQIHYLDKDPAHYKGVDEMMMKFKVANEIKGTPVVRMLFRDWNCYQVYLRWAQSGKVFCVT